MILQDVIAATLVGGWERFAGQFPVPVIIQFKSRRRFSSSSSGTSLSDPEMKNLPQVIQLLRQGGNFPVMPLISRNASAAGAVRVGRSEQNDIVLPDDSVSTRHAVFLVHSKNGTVSLKDLASTNGTWVNGQKLVTATETALFDGDQVSFGQLAFLFFYPRGLYEVVGSLVKK